MSNVTLSIPNEVYLKMKSHKEIRWSEVVRRALNEYIKKLEDKGMEVTTKDLIEELGDDFKKSVNELSFEKAAKEYEKMRDIEWKRVFTTQIH
jgi:predicted CopG family antitoxin